MTETPSIEAALRAIRGHLDRSSRSYALVGGLALAARGEPRFTRDVDLAVDVRDDADAEGLVLQLTARGYRTLAAVEHDVKKRLAIARLAGSDGTVVDLLFASSGIEPEVVARATRVEVPGVGAVAVTRAEELVALKVLSMTKRRRQDRVDALNLLERARVDLADVRTNLALITERGFHREQDLTSKLEDLLLELRDD